MNLWSSTYKGQDGREADLPVPLSDYEYVDLNPGQKIRVLVESDVPIGECDRGVYLGTLRGGSVLHERGARLVEWKEPAA